jgi:hypothetical protein
MRSLLKILQQNSNFVFAVIVPQILSHIRGITATFVSITAENASISGTPVFPHYHPPTASIDHILNLFC